MRCFVAMGIGDDIKKAIGAMADDLRSEVRDGKPRVSWTRLDGWHVTLKFLGDVEPDRIDSVSEGLRHAAEGQTSFTIRAAGVTTFPQGKKPARKPRAIVVPMRDDGESARLAAAIDERLTPLGFDPEQRPYVAHLTVARVRDHKGWDHMAAELRRYEAYEFGETKIDSVALYQSRLQSGGSRYAVLQHFPLTAAA
jgi:2'-5' RNA ligase